MSRVSHGCRIRSKNLIDHRHLFLADGQQLFGGFVIIIQSFCADHLGIHGSRSESAAEPPERTVCDTRQRCHKVRRIKGDSADLIIFHPAARLFLCAKLNIFPAHIIAVAEIILVLFIDQTEPFQCQKTIHVIDGFYALRYHGCQAPRGNYSDVFYLFRHLAAFFFHFVDDKIHETHMAVNESGLHAFDSIAADYVTRLDEFHTGQLCRLFKESIRRDLDTRRDGTAQIFAFFGDTAESRRRSEIDDDTVVRRIWHMRPPH